MEPQQFLLLCGAAFAPIFIVVFFIEGALRKGYYPMRQPVSSLAIGPRGWIQQANFFVAAALTLAYAFGLHLDLSGIAGSIVFPVLVGIIGLGLLGAGIYVTDVTGLPKDRSQLAERPRSGKLHDLAGALVFGLIFVSFFVYAYLSIEAGNWGFAIYSVLSALVFGPSFVLAGAGFSGASKFASYGGFFQRVAICVGFMWLSIVAGSVYQQAEHSLAGASKQVSESMAYDDQIVACYPKSASGAEDTPIPNNSVQNVKETSRLFINMPKDLYPKDILHSWTTVSGNATGGYISNGGLPGEAFEVTPKCWSTQVELDGNGEVDLRVKSVIEGTPDYFVRFIVSPV